MLEGRRFLLSWQIYFMESHFFMKWHDCTPNKSNTEPTKGKEIKTHKDQRRHAFISWMQTMRRGEGQSKDTNMAGPKNDVEIKKKEAHENQLEVIKWVVPISKFAMCGNVTLNPMHKNRLQKSDSLFVCPMHITNRCLVGQPFFVRCWLVSVLYMQNIYSW